MFERRVNTKKMSEKKWVLSVFVFILTGGVIYSSVYGYRINDKSSSKWMIPHKRAINQKSIQFSSAKNTTAADASKYSTNPAESNIITPTLSTTTTLSIPTTTEFAEKKVIKLESKERVEQIGLEELQNINCSVIEEEPYAWKDTRITNDSFCYQPIHPLKCFQDPINCSDTQSDTDREVSWPAFGEYTFLSHHEWVKVLQHGGVVFLYHPCTNDTLVSQLRKLTADCLRRFVLTPSLRLTRQKPIAFVTWGCYLLMNTLNESESKEWIKAHAFRAPASHIHQSGSYKHQLVKPAEVVTDAKDSYLCPEDDEAMLFTSTPLKPWQMVRNNRPGEDLILKRLSAVRHEKTIVQNYNVTLTEVDKGNAAWALASLIFLCGLLISLMIYTKLLKAPSLQHRYTNGNHLDLDSDDDNNDSHSNKNRRGLTSSLIKSSQAFINSFRRKNKRKLESMAKLKLLTPIVEDSEEEL